MRFNRNDPCPCKSGKKLKKCCIDKLKEKLEPYLNAKNSPKLKEEVKEEAKIIAEL